MAPSLAALLLAGTLASTSASEDDASFHRTFVGTSLFSLANLSKDSPDFYELDAGRWLTRRDVLVAHAITWKYHAPLGIPYTSSSFGAADADYPGHVRGYGVGVGYRRFLVGGLFAAFTATPFLQVYSEPNKTSTGFQLFLVLRAGYQLRLFDERVFVEPSIAFNAWLVQTNVPASFQALDRRWPSWFLFEPGLNAGVLF